MMQANLVITSAATITPYGLGVEAFVQGITTGPVQAEPLENAYLGSISVAKVPQYDARELLATRIISNFDRLTRHVCVAVDQLYKSIGLDDSNLRKAAVADQRVSFVCGTSGPLQSIVDIDLQVIEEPHYVQPSLIPNMVFNSAASYAAIRHGIRGSCITLTDGDTSSLQAFALAATKLQMDKIDFALVGGAEEATPAYALYRASLTGQIDTTQRPLSEGATIFALERTEHAELAGRASLAGIYGCAHLYAPGDVHGGIMECLKKLRQHTGLQLDEVGVVCAEPAIDLAALGLGKCRRLTLADRMGETGAMYGTLAVLDVLTRREVVDGETVLLLQVSPEGACAAMLMQKHRNLEC
jgi:3-oxoacyl-[acyl-carrier-protein] synthase II